MQHLASVLSFHLSPKNQKLKVLELHSPKFFKEKWSYFHTIGQNRAAAHSIKSKQEAINFFWDKSTKIWEKLTPSSQAAL